MPLLTAHDDCYADEDYYYYAYGDVDDDEGADDDEHGAQVAGTPAPATARSWHGWAASVRSHGLYGTIAAGLGPGAPGQQSGKRYDAYATDEVGECGGPD